MAANSWREVLLLDNEYINKHLELAKEWYAHRPAPEFHLEKLREWQAFLDKMVEGEPDDRTIIWVSDYAGGAGKSQLVKHWVRNRGALLYRGGKYNDFRYMVDQQKLVVFDLVRATKEELVPYSLMEEVKDGLLVSHKYRPVVKQLKSPWVVVFANIEPDYMKLSFDRWQHYRLAKDARDGKYKLDTPITFEETLSAPNPPLQFDDSDNTGLAGAFDHLL